MSNPPKRMWLSPRPGYENGWDSPVQGCGIDDGETEEFEYILVSEVELQLKQLKEENALLKTSQTTKKTKEQLEKEVEVLKATIEKIEEELNLVLFKPDNDWTDTQKEIYDYALKAFNVSYENDYMICKRDLDHWSIIIVLSKSSLGLVAEIELSHKTLSSFEIDIEDDDEVLMEFLQNLDMVEPSLSIPKLKVPKIFLKDNKWSLKDDLIDAVMENRSCLLDVVERKEL